MTSRGSFGGNNDGGYGSYGTANPPAWGSYGTGNQPASHGNGNDFIRLSQAIGNNIQKITQNVGQIQKLALQIGTNQDSPELRDKLHQVQHFTNQLAKDTNKSLKDLAQLPQPSQPSEQRQRKVQRERLMNDWTTALNALQSAQRRVTEKEKESLNRARAHSGIGYDALAKPPRKHDPFVDEQQDDQLVGFDSHKQTMVQMEEDVDLQGLREREQSIRQLESDIMDVNQIFKDLAMLVHEQGSAVDSIEANVESAAIQVVAGTEELNKAKTYQSKARRKKCIILIIVLVILAIIGLIIGLSVKH